MEKFLWEPSDTKKKESLLEDFSKFINLKTDYQLKKGVIPFEYTMCVKK